MIRTEIHHETVTLYVKQTYSLHEVFNYLSQRGYKVKSYLQKFPAEQGFLIDDPATERWTFTATKDNEPQSNENLYLKVFEREIKKLLTNGF